MWSRFFCEMMRANPFSREKGEAVSSVCIADWRIQLASTVIRGKINDQVGFLVSDLVLKAGSGSSYQAQSHRNLTVPCTLDRSKYLIMKSRKK